MTYQTYNCQSFTIHTIKTNKFKTCHLEIMFRKKAIKEELALDALLVDCLTETSLKYPTRREMMLHLEDLYKMAFWGITTKVGNINISDFVIDFIDPEYINEDNYLEEVLAFPFEIINNPNVANSEFNEKSFKICQKRCILDAKAIEEDAFRLSINKTLENLDPTSPTSFRATGTPEEIEAITPSSLYKHYQKLFKDQVCDIFLIGNLDMDKCVSLIKKYFKKRIINNEKLEILVANKPRKKVLEVNEKGNFVQTNLNVLYNLCDLDDYERNIVFNLYNYILGSGGITSKLYQEIREKNSYCYAISSMYLKHDNLLLIHVSLDNANKKNAIKLIKKVIKDMEMGKFSEEEIDIAKQNYELALKISLDNQIAILNNYVFKIFDNLPELEERLEKIKKVTKEDIMKVAHKLKINTIFALEGEEEK